ncbi:shikimate dehydrogenase [Lentilitoribacter sp. Alg239-R112]|uniref:shikimate dehydrogenase n=1 Tax=Lentilitoribacter sp. Alg239-R112 TaxID=2305987 RepID=UPI0013A6B224|nr:shikimate dehydrogenase [Lentilitoribacter sp. Alg239-R112]
MAEQVFKRAFVVGHPISHSKSPLIHGYWLKKYGLEGSYEAVDVSPDEYPSFIQMLKLDDAEFLGGNVTIPHKEQTFKLVDYVDDIAAQIGAANTIYKEGGKLHATNTDVYGFTANLDDFDKSWRKGKKAIVLGAGGASRAILFALKQIGFDEVFLFNRTIERAENLAQDFGNYIKVLPVNELQSGLQDADLFINTTSLGMGGTKVPSLDFTVMADDALVTDIVYTPLITPFLQMAMDQNMKIADGFGMLLHQAVPGFEHWFGERPQVTKELREIILSA